ncbi:MAG: hypothetical protein WBE68_16330, partial [Candidatus Nitrosopolaris sp.]
AANRYDTRVLHSRRKDKKSYPNQARRRHYFANTRTIFKNKVHVELSKRWVDYSTEYKNHVQKQGTC